MLIDANAVFLDSVAVTSSEVTGNAVGLTSLLKPGRAEPIRICAEVVEEDFAGGTSMEFKLTQSDRETGSYDDVPGSAVTVPLAELKVGKSVGWRFLPAGVTKPWIKMVVTPSGSFTTGRLFAAVVREESQPYEAGMYIDAGRTVG